MEKQEARKKIESLRETIRHHDYLYHVLDKPDIPDQEFDRFYRQLVALEKEFPDLITSDSPTQRVGGKPTEDFAPVPYRIPMLSLDNTVNENEVLEWDDRLIKVLGQTEYDYVVEPKMTESAPPCVTRMDVLSKGRLAAMG